MKKLVLFSVLATVVAGGIFAAPEFKLSAGGGGYFTSDFGGGVERGGESMKTPYYGGGGFAFFDATYAELSAGVFGAGGTVDMGEEVDTSFMGLDIGVLGKYPFAVSEKLSVFPLLGITYRVMLSAKQDGKDYADIVKDGEAGDFSALWFKLGGGLDYSFTEKVYLRGSLLYGVRLANKMENDMKDDWDADPLLGHGLEVKIAVGYKF